MTINLDELRKRAELPNALHGCSSDPCGSVVCQTARDRDELLSRLEQAEQHLDAALEANKRWAHRSSRERSELFKAEQDRVKLRNRLDAMRRQRDGYQNQLRKAEQQVARVQELREGQLCGHCADEVQDALEGELE